MPGLAAIVEWLDDTSVGTLVIIAFVLRFVASHLPQPRNGMIRPAASGVFLLAYFLHRYLLDGDDSGRLFQSLVRALVAGHIVWSVTSLAITAFQWLSDRLARSCSSFHRMFSRFVGGIRKMCHSFRQWRHSRNPPPPVREESAPPPPRAAILRQQAEAAQADYEAEVAALAGLPLDEDEREMLLNQAKQRLLHKLKQGE
jgi:hypothetical protein